MEIPKRVCVREVVSSRYVNNHRPGSWDSRIAGIDVIKGSEGQTVRLLSDGSQSPPKMGWEILLTDEIEPALFTWTLYSIAPGVSV